MDVPHFHKAVADTAAAVHEATEHFEPVDGLAVGLAEVERFASSRRVKSDDGKIMIRYSSTTEAALHAAPEGLVDRKLRTITFLSGQRALVRLHYYATHPQSYYNDGRATSDTVGLGAKESKGEEGCRRFTSPAVPETSRQANTTTGRPRPVVS